MTLKLGWNYGSKSPFLSNVKANRYWQSQTAPVRRHPDNFTITQKKLHFTSSLWHPLIHNTSASQTALTIETTHSMSSAYGRLEERKGLLLKTLRMRWRAKDVTLPLLWHCHQTNSDNQNSIQRSVAQLHKPLGKPGHLDHKALKQSWQHVLKRFGFIHPVRENNIILSCTHPPVALPRNETRPGLPLGSGPLHAGNRKHLV